MLTWFFNILKRRELKSQSSLPFAMARASKEVISSHISEIMETTENSFLQLKKFGIEYNQLKAEEEQCHHSKDEFGKVSRLERPLFTQGQVAAYRNHLIWGRVAEICFVFVESLFFFMIAQNISGGATSAIESMGSSVAKYIPAFLGIVALAFAIINAFMLDKAWDKIVNFFYAREHYNNDRINKAEYRAHLFTLIMGIILALFVVSILLFMNMMRSYAIDGATNSSSHNPYLSWALTVMSIGVGIWMGINKRDMNNAGIMLSIYGKWKGIVQKMQNTHIATIKSAEGYWHQSALIREKCYQLILDLQWTLEREADERDNNLWQDYRTEIAKGNLKLTAMHLWEYKNLSAAERELFELNFSLHERLSYMNTAVGQIVNSIEADEAARLNQLTEPNLLSANEQLKEDLEIDNKVKELVNA